MTIENRVAKLESLPAEVFEECKKCDVLVKGPFVTPRAGEGLPNLVSANSLLRRGLNLFAAVRPIKIPDKGINWTFFRENIEGEYIWGNKGIEAGGYTAEARLRYRHKENFEAPAVPELKWRIAKQEIDLSGVEWDYDGAFVYDDKPKTVRLKGVPEGLDVVYTDNSRINAGTYTARARLTTPAASGRCICSLCGIRCILRKMRLLMSSCGLSRRRSGRSALQQMDCL